ncbi:MAG: ATPase [Flavobacteriales bacterium]|nr:ATPase [Flavobacteriales bacterium]
MLRTVLRREVVALTRLLVVVLTILLALLELGYRGEAPTSGMRQELLTGLMFGAGFVMFGAILRTLLKGQRPRKAEIAWFLVWLSFFATHPIGLPVWEGVGLMGNLIFLGLFVFIELSRLELGGGFTLSPALLFTFSFILLITIGTALFMLPKAAVRPLGLIEALFTSTSAVCVTGLTVFDVGTTLTPMGLWILLLLVQLGGLGVMTFTSFFAFFFKGSNSLEEQLRIRDLSNTTLGGARRFIVQVILFTLAVEAIGALFIFQAVPEDQFASFSDRLFFAVFHAISAFNNAGFSTYASGLYDPVMRFNYALQWVVAVMIVFGGLGFGIIFNFANYLRFWVRARVRKWTLGVPCERYPRVVTLSTKLVLFTTAGLLLFGTIAFWVFERDNALREHGGWFGQLTTSFFGSVTPRTAGFNTVNYGTLTVPTLMITILLMYIGASPGSTGGGIKTSTAAVALFNIFSTGRGRERVETGGREIGSMTVRRAFATIVLSLIFLGVSVTVVASLEKDLGLLPIAFECFSAFSTVGLSTGITAELDDAARVALTLVMFVGRVSALTLLIGVLKQVEVSNYRYPKEDILIN